MSLFKRLSGIAKSTPARGGGISRALPVGRGVPFRGPVRGRPTPPISIGRPVRPMPMPSRPRPINAQPQPAIPISGIPVTGVGPIGSGVFGSADLPPAPTAPTGPGRNARQIPQGPSTGLIQNVNASGGFGQPLVPGSGTPPPQTGLTAAELLELSDEELQKYIPTEQLPSAGFRPAEFFQPTPEAFRKRLQEEMNLKPGDRGFSMNRRYNPIDTSPPSVLGRPDLKPISIGGPGGGMVSALPVGPSIPFTPPTDTNELPTASPLPIDAPIQGPIRPPQLEPIGSIQQLPPDTNELPTASPLPVPPPPPKQMEELPFIQQLIPERPGVERPQPPMSIGGPGGGFTTGTSELMDRMFPGGSPTFDERGGISQPPPRPNFSDKLYRPPVGPDGKLMPQPPMSIGEPGRGMMTGTMGGTGYGRFPRGTASGLNPNVPLPGQLPDPTVARPTPGDEVAFVDTTGSPKFIDEPTSPLGGDLPTVPTGDFNTSLFKADKPDPRDFAKQLPGGGTIYDQLADLGEPIPQGPGVAPPPGFLSNIPSGGIQGAINQGVDFGNIATEVGGGGFDRLNPPDESSVPPDSNYIDMDSFLAGTRPDFAELVQPTPGADPVPDPTPPATDPAVTTTGTGGTDLATTTAAPPAPTQSPTTTETGAGTAQAPTTTTAPPQVAGGTPFAAGVTQVATGLDPLTQQLLFGLGGQGGFIPGAMRAAEKVFYDDQGNPVVIDEQVAGFSPDQLKAMQMQREALGMQDPYLQGAGQAFGAGTQALEEGLQRGRTAAIGALEATKGGVGSLQEGLGESADILRGTLGGYDPSMTSQFYDPFEDRVVQQTITDIMEQGAKSDIGARASDIARGGESAFGSRARLGASERQEALGRGLAEALGGIRSRGFREAQQTGLSEFARQKAAERAASTGLASLAGQGFGGSQALAGALSGLGQTEQDIGQQRYSGQFGLGTSLQGLGAQAAGASAADIAALYGMGSQQQGQAQAMLDAQRRNLLQRQMTPLLQYQALAPFISMAPAGQFTTTTQFAPPPSPMQAGLGVGLSALGALGQLYGGGQ